MIATVRLVPTAGPVVPWSQLDRAPDRTYFQTRAWLDVVAQTQGARPVIAQVFDRGRPVGWFTGALVHRWGFRFLGSPLPGWSTGAMGFNLDAPVDHGDLLDALWRLARSVGAWHVEVTGRWHLDGETPPHWVRGSFAGYRLDLARSVEVLHAGMAPMTRRNLRVGARRGLEVQAVGPDQHERFAADLHRLLTARLARAGTRPSHPVGDVEAVLRNLAPARQVLALEGRSPEGELAAVGIWPGVAGGGAGYWLGSSDPAHHDLRPNEALMWAAILTWRAQGCTWFEFGGGGDHKRKFGGTAEVLPSFRRSLPGAEPARSLVKKAERRWRRRG